MKVEELDNFTRIIAYDDDNHGTRIYINGIYINDMDNGIDAVFDFLVAGQKSDSQRPIIAIRVYICELEVNDEVSDRVHEVLCEAPKLTEEQEVAIFNQTYEKI